MHFKPNILLALFALLHASYAIHIQSSRMLDTSYVTKSGNLTINGDGSGYYLNVDLAYHLNDASEDDNFDNSVSSMLMALYTSQTLLIGGSCLNFDPYQCSDYGCTEYTSSSSTPVFPYFQVTGYYANATVILDYSNWELKTNATIATSCSTTNTTYGQGRYGILGLGRNGTQANFIGSSPVFSVYLDLEYGHSTLLFSSNTNITSISTLIGSLTTNADWNVLPTSVQISCLNYTATENLGAIFDINTNGIGVPISIFNGILQTLEDTGLLNCENGMITPECYYYYKSGLSLPTIKLTIQGQEIDLPPDLYALGDLAGPGTATITLNLKAVDISLSNYSYVTSAYQNYIVFDKFFLAYYYTEYTDSGDSYTVTLYKPNFNTSRSVVVWPWIVGGVFGFIVLVVIVFFFIRRYRHKKMRNDGKKELGACDPNKLSPVLPLRDYTTYNYGQEPWISPDLPQSS